MEAPHVHADDIGQGTFFDHSYGLMMACGGPGGEVIEVDSPPPKRVKVEDVSYHKEWKVEAVAKLHRQLSMQTRGRAITIADSQAFDLEKELELEHIHLSPPAPSAPWCRTKPTFAAAVARRGTQCRPVPFQGRRRSEH